jgi:hypothetical protein
MLLQAAYPLGNKQRRGKVHLKFLFVEAESQQLHIGYTDTNTWLAICGYERHCKPLESGFIPRFLAHTPNSPVHPIKCANIPSEHNNIVPSFIIVTDMAPALLAAPSFQHPSSHFFFPTSPGRAHDAPSPTTSELRAELIRHSMVPPSHSDTHFRTTSQLHNSPDQSLTTHALLDCNMPGHYRRASNTMPLSKVLTAQLTLVHRLCNPHYKVNTGAGISGGPTPTLMMIK